MHWYEEDDTENVYGSSWYLVRQSASIFMNYTCYSAQTAMIRLECGQVSESCPTSSLLALAIFRV
jgi:hypothetical protein